MTSSTKSMDVARYKSTNTGLLENYFYDKDRCQLRLNGPDRCFIIKGKKELKVISVI